MAVLVRNNESHDRVLKIPGTGFNSLLAPIDFQWRYETRSSCGLFVCDAIDPARSSAQMIRTRGAYRRTIS